MLTALLLTLCGLAASAFFSGTETGLYRVPRVRLVLDGVAGSWTARFLLWFTNHPAAFVSTVLVGNNVANYAASFGIVSLASFFFSQPGATAELAVTLLSTPVLFIYGELLPKSLFYNAPSRLLRLCGGPLFAATVLLAPISLLLYAASLAVQRVSGQTPLKVFPGLARRELRRMLQESGELGLLTGLQRSFAQNILAYGGTPIRQYCMPLRGLRAIPSDAPVGEIHAAASRALGGIIPVQHPSHDRLVGYYRVGDLMADGGRTPKLRALLTLSPETSQAVAVSRMLAARCELARVVDGRGELVGVILQSRLLAQMMQQEE